MNDERWMHITTHTSLLLNIIVNYFHQQTIYYIIIEKIIASEWKERSQTIYKPKLSILLIKTNNISLLLLIFFTFHFSLI